MSFFALCLALLCASAYGLGSVIVCALCELGFTPYTPKGGTR
ncbi:hypothetical protein [Streptomyces sp. KL116D]